MKLHKAGSLSVAKAQAVLFPNKQTSDYQLLQVSQEGQQALEAQKASKRPLTALYAVDSFKYAQSLPDGKTGDAALEEARRAGASLFSELKSHYMTEVAIAAPGSGADLLKAYAEGIALAAYRFSKYLKEKDYQGIDTIHIVSEEMSEQDVQELNVVLNGALRARDLVNEPLSHLSAVQLGEEARKAGEEFGFKVDVWNKKKIESMKMGGLLSVNAGSQDPPTFTCMEYKPDNAVNGKPVVLVGKGVVFDTGGLSLKPTANSMDLMKSDMAGAAAVIGIFCAVAGAKLPIHLIGLIPATDNRPGERATAPGDVITMFDGTTVEVLNTDAEGRLILADALTYAKRYEPELVMDFATLTGSAMRAIGQYGSVYMGTAGEEVMDALRESGSRTGERIVEFPLWDEYGEMLKSDIADLKNVASGANAGAITAGKFLQHFTSNEYPWVHFDIAGTAFLTSGERYTPRGATGVGVRLIFDFLKHKSAGAK